MYYKIIQDEAMLRSFIDWLPDLEEGEAYYVSLLARNKYSDVIKSDKQQLKRFTSKKGDLYYKILQLECPLGAYTQKGNPIPQEALALYITPNPRSLYDAMFTGLTALAKCIQHQQRDTNPHQEIMSEIQKSKSRSCFIDFDFDYKAEGFATQLQSQIYEYTGPAAKVQFIETRGGFHVLIDPSTIEEQFSKSWFNNIRQLPHVDQTGDLLIPTPGCTQGGFVPFML
ncbi:hypothetical protein SAMN05421788_101498 [Filimonas lacunae]|uniref:Uncharacterized protein n=1 Tax=Filimonas lacunae TaxID=477680 RepID=A0A173MNS9_9BACT|nr:hypothetical protein [Filimonas lacunae]BAV09051.1 hypothetical protein FLA_5098 [Filimonas lacunae]SIS66473.1 hypothetical protein SAMN05421788_101498 [Filimonas lacunae]